MKQTLEVLRYVGLASFGGLTFACLREWRIQSSRSIRWAAIAFGSLTAIGLIGLVLEQQATQRIAGWLIKGLLVVLILFPYFLYRFAAALQMPRRAVVIVARLSTAAVVIYTAALPRLPYPGTPAPGWWTGYRIAVLVQWTLMFSIIAVQLWRGASAEATVVRLRMRTLALATLGLNLAILLSGVAPNPRSQTILLLNQILSLTCSALFYVGLAPPEWLLHVWRRRDGLAFQSAMGELFRATTQAEASAVLLPHALGIIGARGGALVSPQGQILASHGSTGSDEEILRAAEVGPRPANSPLRSVQIKAGTLLLWTSPYAPFFGRAEMEMLDAWGMFVDMAMERCAFADRQRTFIANAAHELRTPLTTILGVSTTLAQRWRELSSDQLAELNEALERQGERAVRLVTNLLDLAHLDSGRLPTSIEPVSLSAVAKRALLLAPPPQGTRVEIEIDSHLHAQADPDRLEQILVNLLTNSYRYGHSDVRIEARDEPDAVVLAVSDGGPGVQQEVVPHLFEPFVRGSNARQPGSGLGLAISRRLAEAFGGMLWYTPGSPSGACFSVRLRRAA